MAQTTTTPTRTADGYGRFFDSDIEFENSGVSTGSSYADLLTIDNRATKNSMIITLVETGAAQSFFYKILASIKSGTSQPANTDPSYIALRTDVSVAASGSTYESISNKWKWIIVQVKNNSGSATVTGRARTL